MGKLHELLAVERDLRLQAENTVKDLLTLFKDKRGHFNGIFTTTTLKKQEGETFREPVVDKQQEVETTVGRELRWIKDFLVRKSDTSLRIAEGNMRAKADVQLGAKTLVGVPASHLLELERTLGEWLEIAKHIPTLDPGKGYAVDTSLDSKGEIYKSRTEVKERTKKTPMAITKTKATKEHPEVAELVMMDIPDADVATTWFSGAIQPAQKANILANIEAAARAVKKARMRANDIEIEQGKAGVAGELFDFAFSMEPQKID